MESHFTADLLKAVSAAASVVLLERGRKTAGLKCRKQSYCGSPGIQTALAKISWLKIRPSLRKLTMGRESCRSSWLKVR